MEKTQTAVDWLEERFEKFIAYYEGHHKAENYSIHQLSNDFDQAKQMEKEQIINAVYDSMGTNFDPNMGRAEQYYNETFKKQ
jgi:hypothetical protein